MWTIEKYGSVNGDLIYYRKIRSLIEARWGMNTLPPHGKVPGDQRDFALILKNRFENGRRTSAAVRAAASLPSAAPRRPPCFAFS